MLNRSLMLIGLVGGLVALAVWAALGAWTDQSESSQEHPTVPQLIEALGPQLNDEQDALLADGVLTKDEYEGAVERLAQCLISGGLSVTREPGMGVGRVTALNVSGDLRIMSPEEVRTTHIKCVEKHTGKLGIIWAETNRPTPEKIASREAFMNQCMVDRGFDYVVGRYDEVIGRPTDDLWPQGSPEWKAYWDCSDATVGEFGR